MGVPGPHSDHGGYPRQPDDPLVSRFEARGDLEDWPLFPPGLQVPRRLRQHGHAARLLHRRAHAPEGERRSLPPEAASPVRAHQEAHQVDERLHRFRALLPHPPLYPPPPPPSWGAFAPTSARVHPSLFMPPRPLPSSEPVWARVRSPPPPPRRLGPLAHTGSEEGRGRGGAERERH